VTRVHTHDQDLDDETAPVMRLWASVRPPVSPIAPTASSPVPPHTSTNHANASNTPFGAGEGEREGGRGGGFKPGGGGDDVWSQRVAMELRYPLRVFAVYARQSTAAEKTVRAAAADAADSAGGFAESSDSSTASAEANTNSGAGKMSSVERWREMLQESGMTWEYSPLARGLPAHWHIEKFVDDDGSDGSVPEEMSPMTHTEEEKLQAGRGTDGAAPDGGTSIAAENECDDVDEATLLKASGDDKCVGNHLWVRSMATVGRGTCIVGEGRGADTDDLLGGALQLKLEPFRLACGDLRPLCL